MALNLPDLDSLRRRAVDALGDVWGAVFAPARDPGADRAIAANAVRLAPVVWLIGKVQSGKSSIVQALTEASEAEIGSGYKACTATSRIFDFPADAPVIRFLDTRGLGETGYDPAADIAVAAEQAHLLLVVMKAMDPAQEPILDVVRAARRVHPDWPVLMVHTNLHEAYMPGRGHVLPYPFDADSKPKAELPGGLARAIAHQQARLAEIPGTGAKAAVAVDFTKDGDGLEPRLYGLEALRAALARVAPAAVASALGAGREVVRDQLARAARPHILGYAAAAAAADVLPVAGAVAVPGVQAKMLHSLAAIYGVEWDRRMVGELTSALGTGAIVRALSSFGARQLAKLVPVYGQTAGAAMAASMSFATTYALGQAAAYYLSRKRIGEADAAGVLATYQDALRSAFDIARARQAERSAGDQDKPL